MALRFLASRKLIYENVAIGVIAQRIAECRIANKALSVQYILTQQTRSLEPRFRDSALIYGDKILAIEFKSPRISNGFLVFEGIDIHKLQSAASLLGALSVQGRRNNCTVVLGLIHAALSESEYSNVGVYGLHLWSYVPKTTVFIPLTELEKALSKVLGNDFHMLSKLNIISIRVLNASPKVKTDPMRRNLSMPTCLRQGPITYNEALCASCGGLLNFNRISGKWELKKVNLDLEIALKDRGAQQSIVRVDVRGYTLASLLKAIHICRVGALIAGDRIIGLMQEIIESMLVKQGYMALVMFKDGAPIFFPIWRSQEGEELQG